VLAATNPTASTSVTLGAYDGTLNYVGTSGTVVSGLTNSQTVTAVLPAGSTGSDPFVGSGTVALPVSGASSLSATGPANMQIRSHASAGAAVTLSYNVSTPNNQETFSGCSTASYDASSILVLSNGGMISGGWLEILETTPVQTFTVADSTTGWTNTIAAQQFDPSLGTLVQVNITVSNDIQASVAAANLDPEAASIATSQTATVTVDLPGSSQTVSSDASVATDTSVAGADGSTAFAGPSGFIDQGLTAGPGAWSANGSYATGAASTSNDLAAYTGSGTIDLSVVSSSSATLDGPGNLLAQLLAQSGATVTVSYTYAVPEGAINIGTIDIIEPPAVTGVGTSVSFVPGTTVIADSGIGVSATDTSTLIGATVTISSGLLAGDLLIANTAGTGITASYDATDGLLTLTGTASIAAYQQVLRSVAFSSGAADPTAGRTDNARTLSWMVNDDVDPGSTPVTTTIDVQMPAIFTSTGTENVSITQAGTYTVTSQQSAGSVVLDSPGATLVLDAPLDVAGGFTLEAGTLAFAGGTLLTGAYTQTGGMVTGAPVNITSYSAVSVGGGTIASDDTTITTPAGVFGRLVTAESLGLNPVTLATASGAGPGTADIWQLMTQTDIVGPSSIMDILLNPDSRSWVALTVAPGAALSTGMVTGGGAVAALSGFLSFERNAMIQSRSQHH